MKNKTSLLLSIIFIIGFAIAAHTITTSSGSTSYSLNEDTEYTYNITVNNTDTESTANITEVNITIPSSFTFTAGSNGTDAGDHTFTNTSTVLSWSNSTYIIMNLTAKYFWFNSTASTPGDYNITITTTNATSSYSSNISVTINDTTGPTVTLTSPANATSATTSAYNFTFTISDVSNVSNCTLTLDGSDANSLTGINSTNGTYGMYNSSLSTGSHNWSVNCSDSADNVGASAQWIFTVSAATATNTTTTTSGSTGLPNYRPNEAELKKGYTRILYKGWKISFNMDNIAHTIEVDKINSSSATMTISSDPMTVILSTGEEKKVDLDDNEYYDILLRVNSIDASGAYPKGNFTLTSINEKIVTDTKPIQEAETTQNTEETTSTPGITGKITDESQGLGTTWIILIVIIGVLVIGFIIYRIIKKK